MRFLTTVVLTAILALSHSTLVARADTPGASISATCPDIARTDGSGYVRAITGRGVALTSSAGRAIVTVDDNSVAALPHSLILAPNSHGERLVACLYPTVAPTIRGSTLIYVDSEANTVRIVDTRSSRLVASVTGSAIGLGQTAHWFGVTLGVGHQGYVAGQVPQPGGTYITRVMGFDTTTGMPRGAWTVGSPTSDVFPARSNALQWAGNRLILEEDPLSGRPVMDLWPATGIAQPAAVSSLAMADASDASITVDPTTGSAIGAAAGAPRGGTPTTSFTVERPDGTATTLTAPDPLWVAAMTAGENRIAYVGEPQAAGEPARLQVLGERTGANEHGIPLPSPIHDAAVADDGHGGYAIAVETDHDVEAWLVGSTMGIRAHTVLSNAPDEIGGLAADGYGHAFVLVDKSVGIGVYTTTIAEISTQKQ